MKIYQLILFFLPISFLTAETSYEFGFSDGANGWVGDFCDYPVGEEAFFELSWGWENLPVEVQEPDSVLSKGLFLSGNNHSDDLFMFVKRQISDLRPNTLYALTFSILIESNISPGMSIGIGGSPGKSVYFKAGASIKEPKKMAVHDYYLLSIDKGNQSQGGANAVVIGDLENSSANPFDLAYFPKHLSSTEPLLVQSDAEGRLWVFLGTDSGFEGQTKFYIAKISLRAVPV